ncbi:hypothetical protein [Nocardioides sp. T2.26MG-1]|uniref:hypothetical protein n=1 Tax=Nocardioides sp. T2.26MG-1 TaxID=3041166 RepID=UPI002477AAEE|nr:hypothetical protein [Nocardioides sp. T2.26MG-1]CAI9417206.1 hypothetical protein HIDPHFAB_02962 [Nocardioides sp. T2.26MG-1]
MTSTLPKPDLMAALKVETTVELVDYEGLGTVVSELTSDQQANFLAGLVEGFSRFDDGTARGKQIAYVSDEFKATPGLGRAVIELLREFADHIEEVTA